MNIKIEIPKEVEKIIKMLEEEGFEAYIVGGCVRDSILGIEPKDWDICTSATTEEIKLVFGANHVVPTGEKHGTMTVVMEENAYEVTTFRKDTTYSDNRHPDEVIFVKNIKEDLGRRDFTINAMAYSPHSGLVDPYGGIYDLECSMLRCVGNPDLRFSEDALRILRALRFAANYGLQIEEKTGLAIKKHAHTLSFIAKERITSELLSMLGKADKPGEILMQYKEVLFYIIPELRVCDGFDQNTPWHEFDVLEHIIKVVDNIDTTGFTETELQTTRLAALLHDIGKPDTYTLDKNTNTGHFYGHPKVSSLIAVKVCKERLRLASSMYKDVIDLVLYHDLRRMATKRMMNKLGEGKTLMLLELQKADAASGGLNIPDQKKAARQQDIEYADNAKKELEDIVKKKEAVQIKDLDINGNDLKALGIKPGPVYTIILNSLLESVMDGILKNSKDDLIITAKMIYDESTSF